MPLLIVTSMLHPAAYRRAVAMSATECITLRSTYHWFDLPSALSRTIEFCSFMMLMKKGPLSTFLCNEVCLYCHLQKVLFKVITCHFDHPFLIGTVGALPAMNLRSVANTHVFESQTRCHESDGTGASSSG